MEQRVIAVILAAGSGSRLDRETPKQFSKLAGLTVLEHAVAAFDRHPAVTELILVVPPGMSAEQSALVDKLQQAGCKPTRAVVGGATRNESTRRAVAAISGDDAVVLVHDAARPLLQREVIDRCVQALRSHQAVDTTIECADTIIEVDAEDCIRAVPDRRMLRRGQTPQGFAVGVLREAYRRAAASDDLDNSDDCGVVLRHMPEVRIKCVAGADSNVKITRPIDLATADRLFQLRSSTALDNEAQGQPTSIAGQVLVIFGASSGIGLATAEAARRAGATVIGFSLSAGGIDIRDAVSVGAALRESVQRFGRIDAVVNTVGVLHREAVSAQDLSAMQDTLDTNLFGAFVISRLALPYLRETRGHLVFFTSSSYTRGRATYAAYSASKAGLVNMVQALSEETAADGVKVNCISPERTATRMRRRAFADEDESRMLQPEDVARATLKLLGSDLTGQVVDVGLRPWSERTPDASEPPAADTRLARFG